MKDQVPKAGRITVAEAFRRLTEIIKQDEHRLPDYLKVYLTGALTADEAASESPGSPRKYRYDQIRGKDEAIGRLRGEFASFCKRDNVRPRSLYAPWGDDEYLQPHQDFQFDIALAEFERWAAPYLERTTHELLPPTTEPKAEDPPEVSNDNKRPWQEIAREEATKACLLARRTGGWRLTKESAAEAVAKVFKERGIEGPRGELAASTIYREALQGDLWKIPKA